MPKKLTQEEFIKRANKIHNFKYDYSNLGIDYPYKVFEKKEELLDEINLSKICFLHFTNIYLPYINFK